MSERIYVCHTFYHVYVSFLKEFQLDRSEWGNAEIALSTMSTNFEDLQGRLEASGMFSKVHVLQEKRFTDFPELAKYKKNYGNFFKHIINRIIFTKKYPKLEEPYMTIDFKQYKDIYVYCDSDPIGFYLNYKHIYYHALEDGLDCLKHLDDAHVSNMGHFKMKAFLASKNLIFIQNGFSKYCLDMEINDRSVLKEDCPKYKVVPRKPMEDALTSEQKEIYVKTFIPNGEQLLKRLREIAEQPSVLLLTEPFHFDDETQTRIVQDIIRQHCEGMKIVIKPHPRDHIDYTKIFPDCIIIQGKFPIEVMNFMEGVHFTKAVSIITTAMDTLDFIDEKVNLGASYWDAYEAKELHDFTKPREA